MKTALLCICFIVAVWAFPRIQNESQFKRMYVHPSVQSTWDLNPRIVNGVEAVPNSIPYQAYFTVLRSDGVTTFCGGSLISPTFVLTAAHCINGTSATVLLGAHNINQEESSRIIINSTNLIVHEAFDIQIPSNDIGLIRFDEPVELNENISLVQLPRRENPSNYEGVSALISGWGQTAGNEGNSLVLRWVNSTVISNSQCNETFGNILDSHICIAGNGGVGAFFGDSGGPLIYDNIEIGLSSFVFTGCRPNDPSAFTRISAFLDWIEEQTGLHF